MLVEAWIVKRVDLPIGVSILAIARKPLEPSGSRQEQVTEIEKSEPAMVMNIQ
jgi:hypothetical protein